MTEVISIYNRSIKNDDNSIERKNELKQTRDNQFFVLLFDKVKTIDLAFFLSIGGISGQGSVRTVKKEVGFKSTFRANQRQYDV
jgi:hypothetical protein